MVNTPFIFNYRKSITYVLTKFNYAHPSPNRSIKMKRVFRITIILIPVAVLLTGGV